MLSPHSGLGREVSLSPQMMKVRPRKVKGFAQGHRLESDKAGAKSLFLSPLSEHVAKTRQTSHTPYINLDTLPVMPSRTGLALVMAWSSEVEPEKAPPPRFGVRTELPLPRDAFF